MAENNVLTLGIDREQAVAEMYEILQTDGVALQHDFKARVAQLFQMALFVYLFNPIFLVMIPISWVWQGPFFTFARWYFIVMWVFYILIGIRLLKGWRQLKTQADQPADVFQANLAKLFTQRVSDDEATGVMRGKELILTAHMISQPDKRVEVSVLPGQSIAYEGEHVVLYLGKYRAAQRKFGMRVAPIFYIGPKM